MTLQAARIGPITAARHRLTISKYASPTGDDSYPGTIDQPYLTVQKLADNIGAGQVGAIRAGTFSVASAGQTLLNTGETVHGTSFSNMRRIVGMPGDARPLLVGAVYLNSDYTSLEGVDIDIHTMRGSNTAPIGMGRGSRSVTGAQFKSCRVDGGNSAAQGILIGGSSLPATNCRVIGCVIYDIVGTSGAPGHGIYYQNGDDGEFWGNVFYNIGVAATWGGDRAIQLYPNTRGCYVAYNTADNCTGGIVYGNAASETSGGHQMTNNIISNLVNSSGGGRAAISSVGTVSPACAATGTHLYNNVNGDITADNTTVSGSTGGDPLYVDRIGHDYHLSGGSPAAGKGAWAAPDTPLAPAT